MLSSGHEGILESMQGFSTFDVAKLGMGSEGIHAESKNFKILKIYKI